MVWIVALFEVVRVESLLAPMAQYLMLGEHDPSADRESMCEADLSRESGDVAPTSTGALPCQRDLGSVSQLHALNGAGDRLDRAGVDGLGLDPAQCSLLVVNCQPAVLSSVEDPGALISRVNATADRLRRHGGHIGFVRTAFNESDFRFIPSTNRALSAVAAGRHLQDGSSGAALHEAVAYRPGDLIVRKVRVGAFSTTNLDEALTNLGVTTLFLAGVHTSGAILSTVREAADRDYQTIVLSDCTFDTDTELHGLMLRRTFLSQVQIATSADVCSWLEGI